VFAPGISMSKLPQIFEVLGGPLQIREVADLLKGKESNVLYSGQLIMT
jgi:hypothetical protein